MSASPPRGLPAFGRPPLVEVALSLQFKSLPGFTTAHTGLLWRRYRDGFPLVEEHPRLEPAEEAFESAQQPRVQISFGNKPPAPRVWFLSADRTSLIQVQNDRLVYNWRKANQQADYPRYEQVRSRFRKHVEVFAEFLVDADLGEISVNQCEITYVNQFPRRLAEAESGDAGEVFTNWRSRQGSTFLPTPEDVALRWRFRMSERNGPGRLHVMAQPAWDLTRQPIWTLNLMARGRPVGTGIDDAFAFLDRGREWIVRGFADLTTERMHRRWRRTDAGTG